MTSKTYRDVLRLLSVLAPAALAACGGDEATIVLSSGAGGTGGEPSGNAGIGATGSSTAGSAATGGAGAACVEEPSTHEEFLVRCTDSACRPFDNTARLTRYRAGEPLPEVP